jgi:hypothetical protein
MIVDKSYQASVTYLSVLLMHSKDFWVKRSRKRDTSMVYTEKELPIALQILEKEGYKTRVEEILDGNTGTTPT